MIRSLVVVSLVLAAGTGAFAQCHPPHYRMGLIFADDPKAIVASISMSLQDFSPRNLICLAGHLRERYPGRTSMLFTIFDSNKPTHYNIFPVELEHSEGLQKLLDHAHARYFVDAAKHEDYIELLPLGVWASSLLPARPWSYSTRIDLPLAATPHCFLEMDNRCFVALENIVYPDEALKRSVEGKVVLAGTIGRSGKVDHVRVVKAESAPEAMKDLLATAAVKNLSSWRLEPGPRREMIQITYSYAIDKTVPYPSRWDVKWALPNEVTIRGRPDE